MISDAVAGWWERGGLEAPPGAEVHVTGHDPVLPDRHRCGEMAAAALGLVGAWVAHHWERRGGAAQPVRVDVAAAATTLLGFLYQRVDGPAPEVAQRNMVAVTAPYATADGRWIHLHGGFPDLAQGTLEVLGLSADAGGDPAALAAAVAGWEGQALEDALAARRLCGALVRTADEWSAHPQGQAVGVLPVVELLRVGDAPPEHLAGGADPEQDRPLGGVRVLDLTRVLAGPTAGRTLAEHGADVLRVGAERLPSIEPFVIDTGRGKRNTFLDLDRPHEAERLRELVAGSDVVVTSYRQGALAARGFGSDELAALRPGIVAVELNCYGPTGPWAARAGWEQLAQCVSGLVATGGAPRMLPAAVNDYVTGYLAAYGALVGLARRADEGGSWLVRVSLCQTAHWLLGGHADLDPAAAVGLGDLAAHSQQVTTSWGALTHLPPVIDLPVTPGRWDLPPSPLGTSPPEWLPR